MSGGVENIYMDNIQIGTVKNALYFKSTVTEEDIFVIYKSAILL